ncbi:MAG: YbaB/EbfC family nucleoid-associated protein [Erysipelotrichaceae bacterium]|jgi:DNA-binding YbaB/EbfC family protein|nr:YbaB/EbfC family nucleoid-associated protein [Erysipelotrichaceae bacterium]MBR2809553.1 YbaB/EbfC family nucleoid-associated protein [Erysipelotrichaceae bacterium]
MKDLQSLLASANKMKEDLEKAQEEMDNTIYQGKAPGDLVTTEVKGNYEVEKIEIAEELLSVENKEILQDYLVIALNQALKAIKTDAQKQMGDIGKGLNIPGLF